MVLYRKDGVLLRGPDGKLAASSNCCCGCDTCLNASYSGRLKFTFTGIAESDYCNAQGDNCSALNGDYYTSGLADTTIQTLYNYYDPSGCYQTWDADIYLDVCGSGGAGGHWMATLFHYGANWPVNPNSWKIEFAFSPSVGGATFTFELTGSGTLNCQTVNSLMQPTSLLFQAGCDYTNMAVRVAWAA